MGAMKKIIRLVLFLLIFLLASCASTPSSESSNSKYDDWKYKGFGSDIPEWFEPASANNKAAVRRSLPELDSVEFLIFKETGVNVDQAQAKILESNDLSEYKLYDDFWVRKFGKSEEYTCVMIFKRG